MKETVENIFPGMTERELRSLLLNMRSNKVFKVRIHDNLKDILSETFKGTDYNIDSGKEFVEKYAGKECYVIEDQYVSYRIDYFILEDNNFVVTSDCFVKL